MNVGRRGKVGDKRGYMQIGASGLLPADRSGASFRLVRLVGATRQPSNPAPAAVLWRFSCGADQMVRTNAPEFRSVRCVHCRTDPYAL